MINKFSLFISMISCFYSLSLNAQNVNTIYKVSYGASYVVDGGYVNGLVLEKQIKKLGGWMISGELAYHDGAFSDVVFSNQNQANRLLNTLKPYQIHMFTMGGYLSKDLLHKPKQRVEMSIGLLGRAGVMTLSKLNEAEPILHTADNGQTYIIGWTVSYNYPYNSFVHVVLPTKLIYEIKGKKKLNYIISPYYNFIPTSLHYNIHLVGLSVGIGF